MPQRLAHVTSAAPLPSQRCQAGWVRDLAATKTVRQEVTTVTCRSNSCRWCLARPRSLDPCARKRAPPLTQHTTAFAHLAVNLVSSVAHSQRLGRGDT